MLITSASRICLHIPFYAPRVTRAMQRAQTHDSGTAMAAAIPWLLSAGAVGADGLEARAPPAQAVTAPAVRAREVRALGVDQPPRIDGDLRSPRAPEPRPR